MHPPIHPLHRLTALTLATCLLLGGLPAFAADAPLRPGEPVTLNFNNAEIDGVARTLGLITGRQVVVDPRVKGTLTLTSEKPVPAAEAWRQFLATLRMQGFVVVESAGLHKVVPEADAKLQGGPVSVTNSSAPAASGSQLVTQIFRLNFETANNLVPVLRPLISPNNTLNVNPGNNSLVITDYADNLQRLARIIAAMDVPNASDVEVIPLQHALAADLAPLVNRLIDSGGTGAAAAQGQADTSFKTTLLPEPRSNALILRAANPARVALVKSLVAKLDQPAAGGNGAAGNIHVVYLKNADANKLATTLRAALNASAGTAGAGIGGLGTLVAATPSSTPTTPGAGGTNAVTATGGALGGSASSQPSTGGQIQADPATNSLIITAPEPQYRQLRAVIDKLDGRRAQVLVESLIVEVNAAKVAQFGIQWQSALGSKGDTNIGLIGTNSSVAGANLLNLSTGALGSVLPSNGMNFGIGHKVGGQYVLGFLAQFLENNGDGNVLSTPNLLTLDNEEAKIVIGQNVPFVTGQYTNTGSTTTTVNPFQTIERKDVGLTLRVRPQISENGTVKMAIYQEVSSIDPATKSDLSGPTTNKRSIESNVVVDDGSIVVLGGLLQDEYSGKVDKVPGVGDVPLFGNLFKSEKRTRNKTNLMVFLRPVVVRDAAASEALTMDRYDTLRALQQVNQPQANIMLNGVKDAPVLPALGARAPSNGAAAPAPQATPTAPPAGTDAPAAP